MVSKKQALGDERYFHLGECKLHIGPRGGVKTDILAYRRNGKTKTWAKQPNEFRFPVKHGFYGPSSYITPKNAHMWHAESDCPVLTQLREMNGQGEYPPGWNFANTDVGDDEEIIL